MVVVPSLVKIICIVVDIDIFIGQSSVQGPVSGHLIMLWRERERERERVHTIPPIMDTLSAPFPTEPV